MSKLERMARQNAGDVLIAAEDSGDVSDEDIAEMKRQYREGFDPMKAEQATNRAIERGAIAVSGFGTEVGGDYDSYIDSLESAATPVIEETGFTPITDATPEDAMAVNSRPTR